MFRATCTRRLSFWEMPIVEQVNFMKWFKNGGEGDRHTHAKEMPRTVHGFYESMHPRTEDICRYYPYRRDLIINGVARPTFTQVLEDHYMPPMLNDDERIQYVAAKSGRSDKDIAMELFRMRRLRVAMAQCFRDKLMGNWVRQVKGDWSLIERQYLETATLAASTFGLDFYNLHSYDPYVIYSPYYQTGDLCDAIMNKTIRTRQKYIFVDICVHHTMPRARIPGVEGKCRAPLENVEPSVFDMMQMKLSMCAVIAKQERYVTDHLFDTDHEYNGACVHFFRDSDMQNICFNIHPVELNMELGERVLRDYYDNFLAPFGATRFGEVGINPK